MAAEKESDTPLSDYGGLTPELIFHSVETVGALRVDGSLQPLPSYINRVYEIRSDDGRPLIAKFYRPGRWSLTAIREEHLFTADCAADEIPVVAPLELTSGETLALCGDYPLALFPRKAGRLFELNRDEDYIRAGALIARVHLCGGRRSFVSRRTLTPGQSLVTDLEDLEFLVNDTEAGGGPLRAFLETAGDIRQRIAPLFNGIPLQRIHGDAHRGNILDRAEEGLLLIDFDDTLTGPAVQDLWMLLPGPYRESRRELALLAEGYEQFRPFPWEQARLIEPLRAMRMIYFLAWCARQRHDPRFRHQFPQWGGSGFWETETEDLRNQLQEIEESLPASAGF